MPQAQYKYSASCFSEPPLQQSTSQERPHVPASSHSTRIQLYPRASLTRCWDAWGKCEARMPGCMLPQGSPDKLQMGLYIQVHTQTARCKFQGCLNIVRRCSGRDELVRLTANVSHCVNHADFHSSLRWCSGNRVWNPYKDKKVTCIARREIVSHTNPLGLKHKLTGHQKHGEIGGSNFGGCHRDNVSNTASNRWPKIMKEPFTGAISVPCIRKRNQYRPYPRWRRQK